MPLDPETYDIEIEHVTKRFGDFTAVKDMNLKIRKGEFFSMLGPSGCGKTTTLRMVAGFEQPTEGEIYVANAPVAGVPPYRRPVNTVFQNYALFPHLNVWENVAFGLKRQKVPEAEIKTARARGARDGRDGSDDPAQAEPALGRPAAARGARARPRQPAHRAAPRRAPRRPRRQAAQGHAARAQEAAERRRHHLHLRDPRPGRGAHHERPARRHEPGSLSSRSARPIDIYENPESAFVANFIGVSNIYLSDVISVDGRAWRSAAPTRASGSRS